MIRTEQKGSARWIILDRPEVRNALSAALMTALAEALAAAVADDRVRSIVLTGAGNAFSAGADLNEMKAMRGASFEDNVANATTLSQVFHAIAVAPKPVITRVNGPAIAGALGIVAASDVAVAVRGGSFAFTEVRLGIAPAMISPFVVRRIGPARAQRLFLTGERFSAEDAERWGLLDRVVEPADLDPAIDALTAEIEACAPGALREIKPLVARVAHGTADEHRGYTAEMIARLRASDEGQEGMAAFLEKRKPRW
ncbi:MAG: methylglutaconyl-CoA hydratase [Candidatus Binatota bacterium]|jgi:methylglutaconyl-CoA hydratase|nr:methylglutaconyl-CoA hydratase [Candidatus Binatota bacterium]